MCVHGFSAMNWCPIQDIFPAQGHCSEDSLWIHHDADQVKVVNVEE